MSYLRGKTYIWGDGQWMHIWDDEGQDGWRESVWGHEIAGEEASGVAVRYETLDRFVAMRFAEIVEEGRLAEVIEQSVNGNFGSYALERLRERLLRCFQD